MNNILYLPPCGEPFETSHNSVFSQTKSTNKAMHIPGNFNLNLLDHDKQDLAQDSLPQDRIKTKASSYIKEHVTMCVSTLLSRIYMKMSKLKLKLFKIQTKPVKAYNFLTKIYHFI